MESTSGSDPGACVLPHIRELTTEEARELHGAPMATWLATVALLLIVVCAAPFASRLAGAQQKGSRRGTGNEVRCHPRAGARDLCSAFVTTSNPVK